MASESSWLSHEQRAKAEFARLVRHIREEVADTQLPGGIEAVDALASATLRFGSCELRMYNAQRLTVTGLLPESATALTAQALDFNKRGLTALAGVRQVCEEIATAPQDDKAAGLWTIGVITSLRSTSANPTRSIWCRSWMTAVMRWTRTARRGCPCTSLRNSMSLKNSGARITEERSSRLRSRSGRSLPPRSGSGLASTPSGGGLRMARPGGTSVQ
jgi:hypothetical protein